MAITDFVDTYFTDHSIVYTDVETSLCKFMPSAMFKSDKEVEYREITIPDNTSDSFLMYHFNDNEHVENLYNVRIGRLSEPEELTFAETSDYDLVTDYTHDDDEILIAAIHGNGLLFDTEDDERTVIMEVSKHDNTGEYLDQEIRDVVKFMYYFLYIEEMQSYYNYMNRLSILKKNRMNENTKTKISRKVYNTQFVPLVM